MSSSSERDANSERGAFADFAFHINGAPVHLHDPFRDRQAQARTSLFARPSLVCSPESVKDVSQVRFRNSESRIRDRDDRESVMRLQLDPDGTAIWRVLLSIVDQDEQGSAEGVAVR